MRVIRHVCTRPARAGNFDFNVNIGTGGNHVRQTRWRGGACRPLGAGALASQRDPHASRRAGKGWGNEATTDREGDNGKEGTRAKQGGVGRAEPWEDSACGARADSAEVPTENAPGGVNRCPSVRPRAAPGRENLNWLEPFYMRFRMTPPQIGPSAVDPPIDLRQKPLEAKPRVAPKTCPRRHALRLRCSAIALEGARASHAWAESGGRAAIWLHMHGPPIIFARVLNKGPCSTRIRACPRGPAKDSL